MLKILLLLLALIVLNAIISIARHGILHVNLSRIKLKAEEGNKRAALIRDILENPDDLISMSDLVITILNVLGGIYSGLYFAPMIMARLSEAGILNSFRTFFHLFSILIAIAVSSCFMVFSELIPKIVAGEYAERIAMLFIRPINILSKIFKPITFLLFFLAKFITSLFGVSPNKSIEIVTEEEIRMMLDAGGEVGNIDKEEMKMIQNIFEFDDKSVEDISTHRTDISAIDIDDDFSEIMVALADIKYSRIPVYEENIDNIIGILHVKDLMRYILDKNILDASVNGNNELRNILRSPHFIPTSKKTDELFRDMKINKLHMAVVVDEYGGTVGLVTMEDLVEEIMGNIFDEYDEEEIPEINMLDPNTFEIKGTTSLDLVEEALGIPLPVDDYDTIGGFVIGQLGRIPGEDEQPEVEFDGLLFKVEKVEDKRIEKIIAVKL